MLLFDACGNGRRPRSPMARVAHRGGRSPLAPPDLEPATLAPAIVVLVGGDVGVSVEQAMLRR
ncbi:MULTISPECIES: hypothetical protein [Luteimonas]|uniref:Uncharacterized protein n=1 Tax=Luteimonas chenhongjianii TaxID=2006110 RepID=A0A290XC57_9GAMM|nr:MULTISPECIES: hypothetical protein [Luteimonas]ATD66661.1 hypothetical protein CNR27_03685 [Luteimonas chenhongjianii]RPD85100.1 hypothetical protein EGK76_09185 [Luteimonas sp. 100069]